ncbi:helix-turn-helix domain-containing protein [Streptomyces sp. KL116D]|uniref:helix-turn-helix domain-containing protein n=1 Tax=Streptomyces sp. KL116D TaxID=3045152 RepID=UPI0035585AF3
MIARLPMALADRSTARTTQEVWARDLIAQLELSDDETAGALRVIEHFDSLVEESVPVAAVIRAAAALAGCPAGLHDAGRGLTRRYDQEGRSLPEGSEHTWSRTVVPGRPGTTVWLERPNAPRHLDTLILERVARAVQALTAASAHRSVDEALRIACDPNTSPDDRRGAIARLGLTGPATVTVSHAAQPSAPYTTRIGNHVVTLNPGTQPPQNGLRAGTARAQDAMQRPDALQQARTALRLTDRPDRPGSSWVRYEDLGILAAVAERIAPSNAVSLPDVRRLDELIAARPWAVDTLQAVPDQASLRQAAAVLHVHHSTLQERLNLLGTELGYPLTRPGGRQRASVAVLFWRIAHSDDPPVEGDRFEKGPGKKPPTHDA